MASRTSAIKNNLNDRMHEVGIFDQDLELSDIRAVNAFYDHTCLKCKAPRSISVDHVLPISKGGSNKKSNLQNLCVKCNKAKGDDETDYRNGRICPDDYVSANTRKTGTKRGAPKTAWKPGQSGNPKGRPSAGMSWSELIKAEGDKWNEQTGLTRKEFLVMCAFDHAEKGNAAILKELFQRSEPVADELNLNVNDKRPTTPDERRARLAELLERGRDRGTGLVA